MKNQIARCEFERSGPDTAPLDLGCIGDLEFSNLGYWCSAGHHGRTAPLNLALAPNSLVCRLHIIGVFGLGATPATARRSMPHATIAIQDSTGDCRTIELCAGLHFLDPIPTHVNPHTSGDGSVWTPISRVTINGEDYCLAHLEVDRPEMTSATKITYSVTADGGVHYIFDVFAESRAGCPFHSHGDNVSLSELAAVVRSGDRVRFGKALSQVADSICSTRTTLDEAKSLALTFLGVVCAGLLELGATREMHGFLLTAARTFDQMPDHQAVADQTQIFAESITAHLMHPADNPTHTAIDRALAHLDRNYAKKLSDAELAAAVGLSTSHFRHLFREATGQPYQKYLLGLRLEKAKQFISESDTPLVEVAAMVGFASAPHFSRAFAERFGCAPSRYKDLIRLEAHQSQPVTRESA